jgi:hypothetical protein
MPKKLTQLTRRDLQKSPPPHEQLCDYCEHYNRENYTCNQGQTALETYGDSSKQDGVSGACAKFQNERGWFWGGGEFWCSEQNPKELYKDGNGTVYRIGDLE